MKLTLVLAGICLLTMTVLMSSAAQPQQTRHKRHADAHFTSELSKMRSYAVARQFLKSLGVFRRSEDTQQLTPSRHSFSDSSAQLDHSLRGMTLQEPSYEQNIVADESGRNVFCINWIHTKLLTNSLSEMEEELLAQQVLCPIFTQMMEDMRQNGLPLLPI